MPTNQSARRLLLVATPVGPLGSGVGGGVELTIVNLAQELQTRGYHVTVVAPEGSQLPDVPIVEIAGQPQPPAHIQDGSAATALHPDGVLANMWSYAQSVQSQVDLIINFAYDWLPFYLTPFFMTPVAHFVTMGSLNPFIDRAIERVAGQFPWALACYTRTQAETFSCPSSFHCLGSAVNLERYQYCAQPGPNLAFLGRISPEKGLEDSLAATQQANMPLKIMGKLEDDHYWQQLCTKFPWVSGAYLGFLPTETMQAALRECRALIMTPRWVEAFGNVAIEALACGVPVVAYNRGGPSEIVIDGKTGWLVTPGDIDALTTAIKNIDQIDRQDCRQQAERQYSLAALGDRFENWFERVIRATI